MRVRTPWIEALRKRDANEKTANGSVVPPAPPARDASKPKKMSDSYHKVVRELNAFGIDDCVDCGFQDNTIG